MWLNQLSFSKIGEKSLEIIKNFFLFHILKTINPMFCTIFFEYNGKDFWNN
jgi:hypothetical protein